MSDRFTWTYHPVGCSVSGVAGGDVRATIRLPDREGRKSRGFTVKLTRPGYPAEYSGAPTIAAAKTRAETMLAEAEGASK